ncbi:MAG TPA: TonB-dependent receptor [Rhizomicrobium sp.]|nr:TonB-dependent receptor [Rhizomicrobium sp.]
MFNLSRSGRKAVLLSFPAMLLASAAIPPALAQEQVAANQPVEFVTVTATRGATQQDLSVSSTILTSDQVLEAPEPSIDQIVNKIPGIYTSQQPGGQLHPTGQPFSIRGFGTSTNINTLLLVDGVPANDPYFRTVDWSQVPKDSVNSIEVIRGGGASSAWGNLAMGGIVNVVTRQAQPGYLLDVSGGSFNAIDGFALAGFTVADGLNVSISADAGRTDGYDQTPAQYRNPYMTSTSSQTQDYHLSAVYTPDADTDLYLSLTHHRIAEYGLVWQIAHNAWETDRFAAGGSRALGDAQSLNFTLWYGEGSMFTQNASNPSYSIFTPLNGKPFVSQTETVTYHHVGGSLFYKADFGDFKDIEAGADGREIWAHDPLNIFSATKQTGAITADAKHQFEGIYAQGSWRPTAVPLEITAGAREDFWQAVDAGVAGNFQGSTIADVVPNETYTHFSPRVGAKYFLPDGLDLRVAAYSDFAAPGMNQMYRSFISGASYTTFDATLKPQTNFGREIGMDWNGDDYQLSFTLYDNSLNRFIDYATVENNCALANNYCGTGITAIAGGSLHQYVNAGNATLKGGELLGSWNVLDDVSLNGGVSVTDAYLTSSNYTTVSAGVIPDPIRQQLGQVPRWMITGGATWQVTKALQLSLVGKTFPAYWANTAHTQLDSAATTFDLSGSYRLTDQLELYLAAQNIFNRTYYDTGLGYTTTNGTTVNGTTVPALGIPFNVVGGFRVAI